MITDKVCAHTKSVQTVISH